MGRHPDRAGVVGDEKGARHETYWRGVYAVTADNVAKILLAVIGLLGLVITPITLAVKALLNYQTTIFNNQTARIATLETREQTILTKLVDTAEDTQINQKVIADFIAVLVDDRKYEERRDAEDRRRLERGQ